MAAVKLLDLPPEIIQMIVNRCIQLHGAEAAFTLSSVHSTCSPPLLPKSLSMTSSQTYDDIPSRGEALLRFLQLICND